MEYFTKKEFADRCGVTTVTVFNWIKADRGGISKYNTKHGISADIFSDPAWSDMDTKEGALTRAAQLRRDVERLRQEGAGYKIDLDAMTASRDEIQKRLEIISADLDEARKALSSEREQAVDRAAQHQRDTDDLRGKLEAVQADRDAVRSELASAKAELEEQAATHRIALDAVKQERDNAQHEAELVRARVSDLEKQIVGLEGDKVFLQGQYQQQAEMLSRLMLPEPRRTFWQGVKEALGIKSKQEPQI